MNENAAHDDKLFDILKECKNLPIFLDAVFGFLKRRTDFYCISKERNSPVGLPKGLAEQLVKETFYKWKLLNESLHNVPVKQDTVPNAIHEVIIEDTEIINEVPDARTMTNGVIETSVPTFTSSESYNGAVYDTYSWSQTINDIDIIIKVPKNVTSKDISINILPQKISVTLKKDGTIILSGDFCEKVKHNDVIWSLDQQKLEIHLEKITEFWWNCLILQEPKIDITNIDCSRPYDELSAEAQAKIEELSWNQERKRLGLPTSDEMILQNKLKNAWHAEGSPFTGSHDLNAVVFEH